MKRFLSLLIVPLFILTSCSSDEPGPMGPQGPPGEDGSDRLGYTFEETVTFDYFPDDNVYSTFVTIPDNIATIEPEADAVLVYLLEVLENDQGEFDTWSLIPQNYFLDEGTIQYVYAHTAFDVELIIDGNFDLSTLDPGYTTDQTFRIVVVPSDFAQSTGVNVSDMKAVMKELDLKEADVKSMDVID